MSGAAGERQSVMLLGGIYMSRFARITSIVMVLSLTGCFSIKNTEGLRIAYEDVDLAQSKASELKALKNVTEAQRQEAADMYRNAKSKVNAYLQGTITRAASYTVDEPANKYTETKASESVTEFKEKVNQLRGPERKFKEMAMVIGIAVIVIEEIVKLNNEVQKAAYDRFTQTVTKYMMKNYEDIRAGQPGQ